MITKEFAEKFANDWINCWNSHEIDKVLLHYTENFVIEPPRALEVVQASKGIIARKEAVRRYWHTSMKKRPELHFQLLDLLVGVNSLTIYFVNTVTNKKVAELMSFGKNMKVSKAIVNYSA